jgi:hypothetical protein
MVKLNKRKSFVVFFIVSILLNACSSNVEIAGNSGKSANSNIGKSANSNIPEEYREFFENCPGEPSIEFKFDAEMNSEVVVGYCEHSGTKFLQFTTPLPSDSNGSDQNKVSSSASATPDDSENNRKIVFQTVPKGSNLNSYFELHPKLFPQMAQTIQIDKPLKFSSMSMLPNHLKIAKSDEIFESTFKADYQWSNEDFLIFDDNYTVNTSWFVSIYRWTKSGEIPNNLNLEDGFELIHEQRSEESMTLNNIFSFDIRPAIELDAGKYVILLGSIIHEKNLMIIRFAGQQNGSNTKGGYDNNEPTNCKYTPTEDLTPYSKNYRGISTQKTESVIGTVGFLKKFEVARTKVGECDLSSNMVWNSGDVQIFFHETPIEKSFKYISLNAALPRSSYENLACDPFDERLKNYYLPNGVGPEARAAAACVALDWIESGVSEKTQLTTYFSEDIPQIIKQRAEDSIHAGERAFGKFGSKDRTYTLLLSSEPSFSCDVGKSLMSQKNESTTGVSQNDLNKWEKNRNSGCPGADFFSGGMEPKNFGSNQQDYFMWTLYDKSSIDLNCLDSECGQMWWIKYINHEFVHAIQSQIMKSQPRGPQSPGIWAGEGQAMFYQVTVGELHRGPGDFRSSMITELLNDMKTANISEVKIEESSNLNAFNLPYSAGYFAWEYLIAHYGTERAWSWWKIWNGSTCTTGGTDKCWRQASPKTFGKSDQQILSEINNYINAQISN